MTPGEPVVGMVPVGGVELARDRYLLPVIDALADAFGELAAGGVRMPPRTVVRTGAGQDRALLLGAAAWPGRGVAAVKVTTLTPDNPGRGLPLIHGLVMLTDLRTGQVAALLDGAALTALRTGAVAGLATRLCAPPDAGELAVIGAGVQARALLRAVAAVRPIRSVRVWSRSGADAFAEWARHWLKGPGGLNGLNGLNAEVTVCGGPRDAVRDAGIVCTATSTGGRAPLVEAGWVAPGAHLNVIGGTHEDAIEVDPALLGTSFTVVEERAAALREAGEVRTALADGVVDIEDLHELGDLVTGRSRPTGGTTLMRSVGLPIEDTAAAAAVHQALSRPAGGAGRPARTR